MATEPTSDPVMEEDEQPKPQKPTPKPVAVPRDEELPDDADTLKEELRRAREALKKTNRENADRRRRTEELEKAEEDRKNATLGETDRLKKEAREAAGKAAEAERRAVAAEEAIVKVKLHAEVERQAAKRNWIYPDIAPSVIDMTRVEIDEDGKFLGVKEALERIEKDKPELVSASPRGGTPPREGPRRTNPGGSRETPEEASENYLRASGKYSF